MESQELERKRRIEELIKENEEKKKLDAVEQILSFNKTPKEVKSYLDKYVIGQEEGKVTVSVAIAFHYNRLANALKKEIENNDGNLDLALKNTKTPKANMILIGPSGCGKTYTAEKVSEFVNIPFVKEDITKFSETGYVGRDLSEIIIDLLTEAQGNYYLAQFGIIYLDEIDKIFASAVVGRDVSGMGVQNGLLKLVEGSDNTLSFLGKRIQFSTKNNLFIAGGAFEGLDIIVKERLDRQKVSYDGNWKNYVTSQDLIDYGMTRQFIARFPVRVFYHQLTTEDLIEIMKKSKDSPLHAYIEDFKTWGIDLSFTDTALEEIAKVAEKEGTGARGLIGILNRVLINYMYELPGQYQGKLRIDKKDVEKRLKIK